MFIIGITGGTGCGKTTIVNRLYQATKDIDINFLSSDSYYKDNSHLPFKDRDKLNYDEPNAIDFGLLISQIKDLKNGKTINIPEYCFNTHLRLKKTSRCNPTKILVIEGILILNNAQLRKIIDHCVFLDCPREIRFNRRILRDINERGRKKEAVIELFENLLDDMHKTYVEPMKKFCDLILDTSKETDISSIINLILKKQ